MRCVLAGPGQPRLAEPDDARLPRRRRQFALRGPVRQRRRLRRPWRDTQRRDLRPDAPELTHFLTYGLPSSATRPCRRLPDGCAWLIATRFPYLSTAQLNQVLATTELPSAPLDNGTGWARLNLYAAAGGYGAFPTNVTVNMNAASGRLNAFDVWSNTISGPGGLTCKARAP